MAHKNQGRLPFIPSFARRDSRALTPHKKTLLETFLPEVAVTPTSAQDPASLFPVTPEEIWLEIGFGAGEHLIHRAENTPSVGFIGSEVFTQGITSCLGKIKAKKLQNVRLFTEDARLLLQALPPASIARVFILFPDPWPKVRHHKRRLINPETLELLSRILTPDGYLHLATDHADYLDWMLVQMSRRDDFHWLAERKSDWETPPEGYRETRYQQKAAEEGRRAYFLNYRKV